MSAARVTGLNIYPVKSCRGIAVKELEITATGPLHDRQWMIVDENNKFISLRTFSKLSEIKTSVQGSFLHLYAGTNKILVDFTQDCEQVEEVTVWKDTFSAGIENKSINEALSDFLSKSVKLVRYQKESFRDLKAAATMVVNETRFADSRPVLLVNESSLTDLNQKLADKKSNPAVIERFRANVIIEGFAPYAEEAVKNVKIGDVFFENATLCGRCQVITQDIETGQVVSAATLTTLAEYRKKEGSSKIAFGLYLTPASLGVIKLGDPVLPA